MFGTEAAIGQSQHEMSSVTARDATEEGWAIQEGVPVAARTAATDSGLPDGRFLDREESWLRFNQRVLELAEDPSTPLLERARFLSIFASNLDEFFMVRVAGRIRRIATGLPVERASGLSPDADPEQHPGDGPRAQPPARRVLRDHGPARAGRAGHRDPALEGAVASEQEELHLLFREQIFPVLTPLLVDPAHPFPYISGLSLNLAVMIADRTDRGRPCSPGSRCRRCCPGS